jgi:hypothetical protein
MYALGEGESDVALWRRWALAEFVAADPSVILRTGGLDALGEMIEGARALEQETTEHPRSLSYTGLREDRRLTHIGREGSRLQTLPANAGSDKRELRVRRRDIGHRT